METNVMQYFFQSASSLDSDTLRRVFNDMTPEHWDELESLDSDSAVGEDAVRLIDACNDVLNCVREEWDGEMFSNIERPVIDWLEVFHQIRIWLFA